MLAADVSLLLLVSGGVIESMYIKYNETAGVVDLYNIRKTKIECQGHCPTSELLFLDYFLELELNFH